MRWYVALLFPLAALGCGGAQCVDADGDGYGEGCVLGADCDDANAAVSPGASEVCNGIDDNCNFNIDEGVLTSFHPDADGDGHGEEGSTATLACTMPAGHVASGDDCDDSMAAIRPGAAEVCNGVDDNCDSNIDEGVTTRFYPDTDGDTRGDPAMPVDACAMPSGHVLDGTDCDDGDAALYRTHPLHTDADRDGQVSATPRDECIGAAIPPGFSETPGTDCADADPFTHVGAIDLPDDGIDGDCAGGDRTRSDAGGVFVAEGAPDTSPGTMAEPVGTLTRAISIASAAGKDVFVAGGDYEGASVTVSIYGGYEAVGWTRDLAMHETTITGTSDGASLDATGEAIVLDGLTLRGGARTYPVALRIAGGGETYVSRCTIHGGSSTNPSGSSVAADVRSETVIARSTIDGGTAHQPFGIYANAPLALVHTRVFAGTSSYLAIAVQTYEALTIVGSILDGGRAATTIGIEHRGGTSSTFEVTIVGSLIDAGQATGTPYAYTGTLSSIDLLAVDTIFRAGPGTSPLLRLGEGSTRLVHDLFWGGAGAPALVSNGTSAVSAAEVDACAWAGCVEAAGTVMADPRLTSDGHLEAGSPCLEAGIDPQAYSPREGYAIDLDGDLRPQGTAWDIGPDERP
ncbi:MAG: putative metal-binding motif-containing protein [Sandaracinaceae bacterium]|nr:putative metal-binding motif-containing protein [Sandaracinaceae bacterium]